ncbi:MAG TPA: hypothetical protein VNT75_32190 [Symbiobacteriaceae bacterium]|nr:hypothetical protein [Symbiobacteriaceae bacterium]
MVTRQKVRRIDTAGLSASGLWVRRQLPVPCLTDEALCLAEVQHLWNLHGLMSFDRVSSAFAEVSSPESAPEWLYLLEILGRRLAGDGGELVANHPLSHVEEGEEVRLLALVQPPDLMVPGALVETASTRRMLWLRATAVR